MAYPGRHTPLKGSRSIDQRNAHGLRDVLILCVIVAALTAIARLYSGSRARKSPTPIAGPREVLEQQGIPASDFAKFTGGDDLGEGEKAILGRILRTIGEIDASQVSAWCDATHGMSWSGFRHSTHENRGRFFQVEGDVTSVTAEDAPDRLASNRLVRCEFLWTVGREQQRAIVYAPPAGVPAHWGRGNNVRNERIRFRGMFLKCCGGGRDDPHTPVFVTREVVVVPQLATP